jgi:dGTPase
MRFVEKKGMGCNLSLQVLDGILCHDGETHSQNLAPCRNKDFSTLDRETVKKQMDTATDLRPMTMEGCVVRMCDVISYIGRDIEDAIRLGLITRADIPVSCRRVLGETNGSIVYVLVEDIISSSLNRAEIAFSTKIAAALKELREFNYDRIYTNPVIKTEVNRVMRLYRALFEAFLADITCERHDSRIFSDFLNGMSDQYLEKMRPAEIVRDFIAGMTDAYFLRCGEEMFIPRKLPPILNPKREHSPFVPHR